MMIKPENSGVNGSLTPLTATTGVSFVTVPAVNAVEPELGMNVSVARS